MTNKTTVIHNSCSFSCINCNAQSYWLTSFENSWSILPKNYQPSLSSLKLQNIYIYIVESKVRNGCKNKKYCLAKLSGLHVQDLIKKRYQPKNQATNAQSDVSSPSPAFAHSSLSLLNSQHKP